MRYKAAVLTGVGIINDKNERHEGMKSKTQNRTWKGLGGAWARSTGSDSPPFKEKETEDTEESTYMKETFLKIQK